MVVVAAALQMAARIDREFCLNPGNVERISWSEGRWVATVASRRYA